MQNSELQAELRRVREQLKMERERWRREMTAIQQVVNGKGTKVCSCSLLIPRPLQEVTNREAVVEQLRREVDESKVDRRRSSISKSDLQTSEIMQLRKV